MRLTVLLSLLTLMLFAEPIRWYDHYDEAFAAAKKTHKPLMLFLTQPRCGTCAFMKEKVLSDPAVQSYVRRHFIAAELNAGDAGLPKKYRVKVTPVFTFIDPGSDEIVEQTVGGKKAPRFLETLESVIDDWSEQE